MNKSYKLLIIDDDENCLLLFTKILEKEGYEINTAEKKEDILKEIEKPYDLLLVDLVLHGIEVLDIISKFRETNNKSKIILITGYPDVFSSMGYLLSEYIFDYLIKPISSMKLIEIVSRALEEAKKVEV